MIAKRIAWAAAIVSLSPLWIYRDTFGQSCPGFDSACIGSVAVPCTTGAGTCVLITTGTDVPGNVTKCSDDTQAKYYTFTPPTVWTDCIPQQFRSLCTRTSITCIPFTCTRRRMIARRTSSFAIPIP